MNVVVEEGDDKEDNDVGKYLLPSWLKDLGKTLCSSERARAGGRGTVSSRTSV